MGIPRKLKMTNIFASTLHSPRTSNKTCKDPIKGTYCIWGLLRMGESYKGLHHPRNHRSP